MAKAPKKKKKELKPKLRIERRFSPESSINPRILYALFGVGAMVVGAGAYWQFGRDASMPPPPVAQLGFYLLVAGAVLIAAALWFSSSGDAAIRVGAPGIALERGGLRRMPWYEVGSISWASGTEALNINGKDESGSDFSFQVRAKGHAPACAWILQEARERVPQVVEVDEDVLKRFPAGDPQAGTTLQQDLQVVGKRCAVSGKVIAYEPDARVCPKCERIYHKYKVPKECKCGADLTAFRDQVEDDDDEA